MKKGGKNNNEEKCYKIAYFFALLRPYGNFGISFFPLNSRGFERQNEIFSLLHWGSLSPPTITGAPEA